VRRKKGAEESRRERSEEGRDPVQTAPGPMPAGPGPASETRPSPGSPSTDSESVAAEPETVPLDLHRRLLAEFDNYRKRVEAERRRTEGWARAELMSRLLPLLDDCERARRALTEEPERFDRHGVLIILGRLAEALEREGLDPVAASPGMAFDPQVHEAVLVVPAADVPAGSIAEVLQAGYQAGDRLLRPARVAVARAPEDGSAAPDGSPRD